MGIIFGSVPEWTNYCSGDGNGDGSYGYYCSGDGYDGDGDGSGDGYGYGSYCSGDGDGYGDGYYYGYESYYSGAGYSYGYGSYCSGAGDGYGAGYGYGDGYGYGSYGSYDPSYGDSDRSYGYSYGDGDGYWLTIFEAAIGKWTERQRNRLEECRQKASVIAFWRSDKNGLPSNGGKSNEAAIIGVVHKSSGPLSFCHSGTLHATMSPNEWKGERLWVVAMFGKTKQNGNKFGALEREILGEITQN